MMKKEIVMPKIGLDMEEGTIESWEKKVGDRVTIKAVEWTLVRILYQGSEAYHKVFDADTQREHFGY